MLWHWCFNASVDFFFTPCNWKTSDLGILEHFKNTEWSSWHLQDLKSKPQYLVTFTVGYDQRMNIDTAVKKVSLSLSLSLSFLFLCNYVCVTENVILAVFGKLYNPSISLWWPNNWMGWVWVVKAGYSCERS